MRAARGDGRGRSGSEDLAGLSQLTDRLGRCHDLDEVVTVALDGLGELFGLDHSLLLMLDERGDRLFTIASRGYDRAGIGSEVEVGVGAIGMAAARRSPVRILNLQRMLTYARSAQAGEEGGEREVPLPGLPRAQSQLAAPALVQGHLRGVLAVESDQLGAFGSEDEMVLGVVAHLLANAVELDRAGAAPPAGEAAPAVPADVEAPDAGRVTKVRFFPVDGSTFVDGDYLIKGVAGRILWRLLHDHVEAGRTEFTNREVRLDPSLELPAFRDNLESRLILLTRRLDERSAPMRIEKTGWGRFRLVVDGTLELEAAG